MGVMPLSATLHWGALLGDVDCTQLCPVSTLDFVPGDVRGMASHSVLYEFVLNVAIDGFENEDASFLLTGRLNLVFSLDTSTTVTPNVAILWCSHFSRNLFLQVIRTPLPSHIRRSLSRDLDNVSCGMCLILFVLGVCNKALRVFSFAGVAMRAATALPGSDYAERNLIKGHESGLVSITLNIDVMLP